MSKINNHIENKKDTFDFIVDNVNNGNDSDAKQKIKSLSKKDLIALVDYCEYYGFDWVNLEYLFNSLS